MEAQFQLTKDDFYHYQKYWLRHKSRIKPWMIFVIGILFVLGSQFPLTPSRLASLRNPVYLMAAVVVPLAVIILFFTVGMKALLTNPAKSIPGFLNPQTVKIFPENFSQKTSVSETVFPWGGVEGIEDDDSFIFFFLNRRFACLIPKRAFATPELAGHFRDASRAYWQGISLPVTGSETWPPPPRHPNNRVS